MTESKLAKTVSSAPSLVRAFSWSVGSELVSKAVQPLVYLLLAAILSPEDFGIVATAMIIISLADVVWQAGLGKALVQTNSNIDVAAGTAFVMMVGISIVVSIVTAGLAPQIATDLLNQPRAADPIRVLCLYMIFASAVSVPIYILTRTMQFKKIFFVRMIAVFCPLFVSLPLAFLGYSYWSIITATVLTPVLQLLLLSSFQVIPHAGLFSKSEAAKLLKFSKWVFLSGLLAWFYSWGDSLILASFLSTAELGLYRTGSMLVFMIFGALFAPLLPVIYSKLSSDLREDLPIAETYQAAVNLITVAAVPIATLMVIASSLLETSLLGPQWVGIGFVFSSMSIMVGVSTIVSANGEAYRAMGRPKLEAVITGSLFGVYLGVYLFSVQFGLEAFVIARTLLGLLAFFFHLFFAHYVGILDVKRWARAVAKVLPICIFTLFLAREFASRSGDQFFPQVAIIFGATLLIFALGWGFLRQQVGRDLQVLFAK